MFLKWSYLEYSNRVQSNWLILTSLVGKRSCLKLQSERIKLPASVTLRPNSDITTLPAALFCWTMDVAIQRETLYQHRYKRRIIQNAKQQHFEGFLCSSFFFSRYFYKLSFFKKELRVCLRHWCASVSTPMYNKLIPSVCMWKHVELPSMQPSECECML